MSIVCCSFGVVTFEAGDDEVSILSGMMVWPGGALISAFAVTSQGSLGEVGHADLVDPLR